MMNLFFKKLAVPQANGEPNEIKNVQLWEVRWQSRHGSFYGDLRPELESFTNEADARNFANSLKQAFKLLRITSDNAVEVRKNG